jgi:hypothetical protein
MRIVRFVVLGSLCASISVLSRALAGQTAPAPRAVVALRQMGFLIGEWDGDGWIQVGPERRTFHEHESVRYAAGGAVVVVDGTGTVTSAGPSHGTIGHLAFAVLSYDSTTTTFRWRAFRKEGDEIEDQPTISDRKLVWGFAVPQAGRVRFTITLTPAGEWWEIGEFSRDGTTWAKFFEMTLKKGG